MVDSAFLKKGKAVFSKKVPSKDRNDVSKLIPKGVYQMYSDGWEFAFTFLIDQETDFAIKIHKTTEAEANGVKFPYHWQKREFVNSEENQLWMNILLNQEKAEFPFDAIGTAAELASTMPQSFVGKHFLLEQQVYMAGESDDETILFGLGNVDSSKFHHILSQVDFTDGRLFHSQSLFSMFVLEYLLSDNRNSTAEIITEVDTILMRAARGGRYQCGLYAQWLYGIFDKTGDPYYEPVLLHIYDTYDRGWIPEDRERRIKRQMDRIRKLAPGAQIPDHPLVLGSRLRPLPGDDPDSARPLPETGRRTGFRGLCRGGQRRLPPLESLLRNEQSQRLDQPQHLHGRNQRRLH